MNTAFTSKEISFGSIVFACLSILACSDPETAEGTWLARIPYPDITYRMVFEKEGSGPRLLNVTFKRYDVPMDTIFFEGDSVYLRFGEFFTDFGGRYDRKNNTIVGTWTTEDSIRIPVNFESVHADTVLGMYPRTAKEYHYSPPKEEGDQWPVSSLARQNIEPSLIDSLTYAIMEERYPDVHSVLFARNDSLVYEEYFYTFHSKFRQNIQSVTKSFVSALAGIAIAKGEIENVNDPLCNHLPDYCDYACSEQNRTINLSDVLSMSTGLKWDEATYDYGDPRNSAQIASEQSDPFKYLFSQSRSSTRSFSYNSLNHSMMNAVLKNATNLDNATEITSRLLAPLQIDSYFLGREEHGVLGDIELRPRDMMKLGRLYLRNGNWNNTQIIPQAWITESTSTKIAAAGDLGYGYFWWTRDFQWKDKKLRSFFAWGYGGQYIFVVPELQLVVAMTGSYWTTDPKNHAMEMMENYIIPSCRQDDL